MFELLDVNRNFISQFILKCTIGICIVKQSEYGVFYNWILVINQVVIIYFEVCLLG